MLRRASQNLRAHRELKSRLVLKRPLLAEGWRMAIGRGVRQQRKGGRMEGSGRGPPNLAARLNRDAPGCCNCSDCVRTSKKESIFPPSLTFPSPSAR